MSCTADLESKTVMQRAFEKDACEPPTAAQKAGAPAVVTPGLVALRRSRVDTASVPGRRGGRLSGSSLGGAGSEDRGPHADARRPVPNGFFEVIRHAHTQLQGG